MAAIYIPWECVTDGKTKVGGNFQPNIEALLNDGMTVEVELPAGGGTKKFTRADDFTDWFQKT